MTLDEIERRLTILEAQVAAFRDKYPPLDIPFTPVPLWRPSEKV